MKRVREEQLIDPFNGDVLVGDAIFADKQRLLLILATSDSKVIATFEQVSKRAQAFVQKAKRETKNELDKPTAL